MNSPFILRFQEIETGPADATLATKTVTAVEMEATDADDSMFLDRSVLAGTQTMTEVKSREYEPDPRVRGLRTIPDECC